jgi:hypothetical protein
MSAELQARARALRGRQHPDGPAYVPDTLGDWAIGSYAASGHIDLDTDYIESLSLCVMQAVQEAERRSGEAAAYFCEAAEILKAIQAEAQA